MKRSSVFFVRGALRVTLASVLAAATFAFAQDPQQSANNNPNNNNGWKRVGDNAQVQNPDQQPADNAGVQQDPNNQQAEPQGPPPQQQQPQQGYTPQINRPYGQQPPNRQQQNYPPPPPVPATLTMQSGTYLTVRVNQELSSDKNQPGDAFTASLMQPLVVNGVVVAEPGQTIGGRVATAEKHHTDRPGRLGLQLTNLSLVDGQQVPVTTQFVSRQGGTTGKGTEIGTVAATTGIGAAIGAAAGWGTGAAIGAGAGAAAGLIGVLVTHNHASVVYPEQVLTFRVEAPVTISTANSTQAFRYIEPNEYDRPTYSNQGGGSLYESAAPPAPVYNYAYGYPYYGAYGWGYPYYWGPSFGFYGGYWGRGGYYGGYRGGYYGGYRGGYYGGGYHGYAGGGFRGYAGGGGHVGGGHR